MQGPNVRKFNQTGAKPDWRCRLETSHSSNPHSVLRPGFLYQTPEPRAQPTTGFNAINRGVLCNSCISAYRRGKQWPVAMHLVACMKRHRSEVDDITVGACISCCEKAERWRWAQLSLQSLCKSSVRPSVTSFNAAVSALEKASSWGKVLQSMETMAWQSLQSDVLTQIAAVASCCRQWQLGLVLLDQLGASQNGAAAAAWPPVVDDCEHSLQTQVVPQLLEGLEALERRFLQAQSRQKGCSLGPTPEASYTRHDALKPRVSSQPSKVSA